MVGTQFCLVSYLLPFLRTEAGVPTARGAAVLFAVQGCGIAGRVILAAWSDRTAHRLIPVATAGVAAAVGVAALPSAAGRMGLPLLVAYAGVMGFFAFGWYGPWVVHVAELAPGPSVGLTLTVAMTANQLVAAGPPVVRSRSRPERLPGRLGDPRGGVISHLRHDLPPGELGRGLPMSSSLCSPKSGAGRRATPRSCSGVVGTP